MINSATRTKKNSVGSDNLPASFFPKLRRQWQFLLHLINSLILSDRPFPPSLQTSRLIFISKKDGSLRPISISSRFSALIENSILPRFHRVLLESPKHQSHFGFLFNKSIEMLNNNLLNQIYSNKSKKLVSNLLLIDLSQAYSNISTRHVLNSIWRLVRDSGNLRKFGIIFAFTLKWIVGRCVIFGKSKAFFSRGLPQGSSWSCLAFIAGICLDGLDFSGDGVEVSSYSFADDLSILISAKSRSKLKNYTPILIDKYKNWFHSIGLAINENKTEILELFSKSEKKIIRILGIWYDSNLTFSHNLMKIKNWIQVRINFFVMLRRMLNDKFDFSFWRKFLHHMRGKIVFGLWHMVTLAESVFASYERVWTCCIRGLFGMNKLVPPKVVLEYSGFGTLQNYIKFLLCYRTLTYRELKFKSTIYES